MEFNVIPFVFLVVPALAVMGGELAGIPGRMRRRREASALTPVSLGALCEGVERVLVAGTVNARERITDPLSGGEVIAWRLTVEHMVVSVTSSGGESETTRQTVTLLDESASKDIDITDATGSARVLGALKRPQIGVTCTTLKDQVVSTLPEAVRARFAAPPPEGLKVTVRSQTLAAGSTLHLFGRVVPADSAPAGAHYRDAATAWTIRDHSGAPMVLSDGGAEGVRDELRRQIRGDSWEKMALCVIVAAFGLVMTLGRFPGTAY